jgi:hypothetical protein
MSTGGQYAQVGTRIKRHRVIEIKGPGHRDHLLGTIQDSAGINKNTAEKDIDERSSLSTGTKQ